MRLPPLNALRAFEAAARHGGYIAASEELNVTRGAVSRHVKVLEAYLGIPLFTRQAKGVRLTDAGRQFQPVLAEAFRKIITEVERLKADKNDLHLICPPATSIRWLIPRLEGFRAQHPDIRVRLTTDFYGDSGFDGTNHDLGFSVERAPNRPASVEMMPLFALRLTPACTPDLLARAGGLQTPADLSRFELLHESPDHQDWTAWIAAFAPDDLDARTGQNFPNLDMATRAALMGAGFVMADRVLCREELESGALVTPFPDRIIEGPSGGICLLGSRARWHEPKIAAFRTWASDVVAQEAAE